MPKFIELLPCDWLITICFTKQINRCTYKVAGECICLTESAAPLCRSLNRADTERERESARERERGREREVSVHWDSKALRSRGSYILNNVWANPKDLSPDAFLKRGEKVTKLATHLHFSNYKLGHGSNRRCINCALIKLVPLKLICVKELTLNAILYIAVQK